MAFSELKELPSRSIQGCSSIVPAVILWCPPSEGTGLQRKGIQTGSNETCGACGD